MALVAVSGVYTPLQLCTNSPNAQTLTTALCATLLRVQAPSHVPYLALTGRDQSTIFPEESTSLASIALHERLKKTRLCYLFTIEAALSCVVYHKMSCFETNSPLQQAISASITQHCPCKISIHCARPLFCIVHVDVTFLHGSRHLSNLALELGPRAQLISKRAFSVYAW